MNKPNLVGLTFGRLTVTAYIQKVAGHHRWSCACQCGSVKSVSTANLRNNSTLSCGCLRNEKLVINRLTHGHTRQRSPSRAYSIWLSMKDRCDNPKNARHGRYGGRGIEYDPAWADFERFLTDMGSPPAGKSLDRRDNDGPYSKANCRWATPREQSNNTRRNVFIDLNGERVSVAEASRRTGIHHGRIYSRIKSGADPLYQGRVYAGKPILRKGAM